MNHESFPTCLDMIHMIHMTHLIISLIHGNAGTMQGLGPKHDVSVGKVHLSTHARLVKHRMKSSFSLFGGVQSSRNLLIDWPLVSPYVRDLNRWICYFSGLGLCVIPHHNLNTPRSSRPTERSIPRFQFQVWILSVPLLPGLTFWTDPAHHGCSKFGQYIVDDCWPNCTPRSRSTVLHSPNIFKYLWRMEKYFFPRRFECIQPHGSLDTTKCRFFRSSWGFGILCSQWHSLSSLYSGVHAPASHCMLDFYSFILPLTLM